VLGMLTVDLREFLVRVAQNFGALLLAGGLATLLFRRFAEKGIGLFFDRQFERFRHGLQAEREALQASLQRTSFEHQTRFARLHEKRAEAIERLYGLLLNAESTLTALVQHRGPGWLSNMGASYEALKELTEFFESNRIFLSETTSNEVDAYLKHLSNVRGETSWAMGAEDGLSETDRASLAGLLAKGAELRSGLERRFRSMLGVEPDDA
jgi:hypothetical protein